MKTQTEGLRMITKALWSGVVVLVVVSGLSACGETPTATGTAGSGSTSTAGSGGTSTGTAGQGGSGGTTTQECVNLECQQVKCDNGATTTISGITFSPAVQSPDPLPNIVVYVPNGQVEPFSPGVACEVCGNDLSGQPLVLARSSFDGSFKLEDVPVGDNIPLVIQSGRWRRQVTIPTVAPCVDTAIPQELTRLPRNKAEGDIPKMAIQTGALDAVECTLAKLVDVAEMTAPSGGGRIHLYRATGKDMTPPLPAAPELWSSADVLKQYDTVLMPCSATNVLYQISQQGKDNLRDFVDAGGRLYLTHAGGSWMAEQPEPFPNTIIWNNQPDPPSPLTCDIDTTFPKGKTFADWLENLAVTSTYGELSLTAPQWYVDGVVPPAQQWVSSSSPVTVQHFSFNTPLVNAPADQCGRVLFSNYHVVTGADGQFPETCPAGVTLTDNEKLVEYMLFDVTGCVEPDEPR